VQLHLSSSALAVLASSSVAAIDNQRVKIIISLILIKLIKIGLLEGRRAASERWPVGANSFCVIIPTLMHHTAP
jgi:hypothetical protein